VRKIVEEALEAEVPTRWAGLTMHVELPVRAEHVV
jgi:hypothetical protein